MGRNVARTDDAVVVLPGAIAAVEMQLQVSAVLEQLETHGRDGLAVLRLEIVSELAERLLRELEESPVAVAALMVLEYQARRARAGGKKGVGRRTPRASKAERIRHLWDSGAGVNAIIRATGSSWKTVDKYRPK